MGNTAIMTLCCPFRDTDARQTASASAAVEIARPVLSTVPTRPPTGDPPPHLARAKPYSGPHRGRRMPRGIYRNQQN